MLLWNIMREGRDDVLLGDWVNHREAQKWLRYYQRRYNQFRFFIVKRLAG